MQTEFFFYYTPGLFPGYIVNAAYTANPNFEMESYFINYELQVKWTLKIRYTELTNNQISKF